MMPTPTQPAPPATGSRAPFFRRIWFMLVLLVALLLLAFIPPYVNVNRYQRRITTSISESLGRPVHLDNVTLTLLPVPGFTLDNFVVSEDPAFGAEPVIRANTVHATLRVSSLWRRRVEFSTISLTNPSINLVHTAQGAWNLDSILLQAAHIEAAPTAQISAGPKPRFPYIEATGARLNLKLDDTKAPFSLTEADFSLWLPDPQTWHFRITAQPTRTDIPTGYAGLLHLDGTLGRSSSIDQIPIDLHGEWRAAPLGEVSRILLGRDAGWRGDMTLSASALGTIGSNELHTRMHVEDAHRDSFVPARPLSMTAECTASIANAFHAITTAHCAIPNGSAPPSLTVSGSLGDIRRAGPVSFEATLPPTPVEGFTDILQTFSQRIPPRLTLGGILSGSLTWQTEPAAPSLTGSFALKEGTIQVSPGDAIAVGDAIFRPAGQPAVSVAARAPQHLEIDPPGTLLMLPTTLALGGKEPAILAGSFDRHGYTLHLTGSATPARLTALATALPQFGDGLQRVLPATAVDILRLDLTATRTWAGGQTWQSAPEKPAPKGRRRR